MIKKKAERRKINIYFVGDEKETEERSRDRNRQIKDLQSHLYWFNSIVSNVIYKAAS